MTESSSIVWLNEERVFARVITVNAYFSLVSFSKGGTDYELWVENDEVSPSRKLAEQEEEVD